MVKYLGRFFTGLLSVCALVLTAPDASWAQTGGFFTLSGSDAAAYSLPRDMAAMGSFRIPRLGLSYERYQQTFGTAWVLGGQITIHRDEDGNIIRVMGVHHPDIAPSNSVRISAQNVGSLVDQDIGRNGQRKVDLMINPEDGRYFYRVETLRSTNRWVHWIGAQTGRQLNKFDALANQEGCTLSGDGYGVAYDREPEVFAFDIKPLDCLISSTTGAGTQLVSEDGRQETHDQGSSRRPFLGPVATHTDSFWGLSGRESPGQGALVDAHYYMALADDYFRDQYGFDFVSKHGGPITIHAHYTKNYVNAFWNGAYFAFGDGDGVQFDPLTALDVATHEFTHSVTEFTSALIYQNESGALNESFSDIMAATMERLVDTKRGGEPDPGLRVPGSEWLIGEDFDLLGDGFRNMADPSEDGDPAHYDDRYTGPADNGGVHINSGIPNHAFYKLVDEQGVDIQAAADIFYLGFTGLTENAGFCDARAATLAVAETHVTEVAVAWNQVGVDATLCGGAPVDSPPVAGFTVQCTLLVCDFQDSSTDDGNIVSWSWDFGDSRVSVEENPSHSYAAAGTYMVTLTVTDDGDPSQLDSVSKAVTVTDGSQNGDIGLTASPFKKKGVRYATLVWSGVATEYVDIYLDAQPAVEDVAAASTPYEFMVGGKGGGSFEISVCEVVDPGQSPACSPGVSVNY